MTLGLGEFPDIGATACAHTGSPGTPLAENITGKCRAGDLPSPYAAGTHKGRTDATSLAGVK